MAHSENVRSLISSGLVTEQDLAARGHHAISCGTWMESPTKTIQYVAHDPTRTATIFRSIRPTWDSVDGTSLQLPGATRQRFHHFFRAGNMSCAVDVCLSIAITMNAYIIQRDRITKEIRDGLSTPARALYTACTQKKLAELNPEQLGHIRDELAQKMEEHSPTQFKIGQMLELQEVFQTLFQGIPQFSFTEIHAIGCCDNILKIFPTRRHQVKTLIPVSRGRPQLSLGQAMTQWLVSRHIDGQAFECGRPANECKRSSFRARVILDTPPPRMILKGDCITRQTNLGIDDQGQPTGAGWHFGSKLQFTYFNRQHHLMQATYVAEACVLWLNRNHYIYRLIRYTADGNAEMLEWDHLSAGVARVPTIDWFHKREDAQIYLMIYRCKDIQPNNEHKIGDT